MIDRSQRLDPYTSPDRVGKKMEVEAGSGTSIWTARGKTYMKATVRWTVAFIYVSSLYFFHCYNL